VSTLVNNGERLNELQVFRMSEAPVHWNNNDVRDYDAWTPYPRKNC
jgi:hypothetical protein